MWKPHRFFFMPINRGGGWCDAVRCRKNFLKADISCLFFVLTVCMNGFAETGRGAAELVLQGGIQGDVPFPHRRHQQDEPSNCQKCHALFPQVKNGIALSKQAGKINPMQVMNRLCIKCHRETAITGNPSGPRSCSVCHAIR